MNKHKKGKGIMRTTDRLAGGYTEEKAEMVMQLIRNIVNPRTFCHHARCRTYKEHERTPGCMYSSVVFNLWINCGTLEVDAKEFLKKMENHGKFFHCRIGGMILLHEHLAKKE